MNKFCLGLFGKITLDSRIFEAQTLLDEIQQATNWQLNHRLGGITRMKTWHIALIGAVGGALIGLPIVFAIHPSRDNLFFYPAAACIDFLSHVFFPNPRAGLFFFQLPVLALYFAIIGGAVTLVIWFLARKFFGHICTMSDKTKIRSRVLALLLVIAVLVAGYSARDFVLQKYDAARLAIFARQIADADRVVVTLEGSSVTLSFTGDDARKVVRAVSPTTSVRNKAFALSYPERATFYSGTNVLGQIDMYASLFLLKPNHIPFGSELLDTVVSKPLEKAVQEFWQIHGVTEQSAIQISGRFAEHLGYRLSDYYEPRIADYYPPTLQTSMIGYYWIRYEPRAPMLKTNMYGVWTANYLDISVDIKTGAAKKVHVPAREEIVD